MKHIAYHNKTQKEALEYTSKVIDFGVTLIIYAALNELLTAYVELQQSRYFRQEVKRRAKIALSMRNKKVNELRDLVMHQDFAETYWDAVIDACEKDVELLRNEIANTLRAADVDDWNLYSQAEVARVLLEAAKIRFEEVIKDCTNKFMSADIKGMKNLNLFDVFHEFYIDNIYREWNTICDILYAKKSKDINLSNEETLRLFNSMAEKFAKGLYIDECLAAASKEFPEFADAKIKIIEQ